jgi:hypothetical protein
MEKMLLNFVPQKYKDCERNASLMVANKHLVANKHECKKRLMSCTVETGAQRA